MSWWDSSALSTFATSALKTAQKRIDKVLDIKDDEDEGTPTEGITLSCTVFFNNNKILAKPVIASIATNHQLRQ